MKRNLIVMLLMLMLTAPFVSSITTTMAQTPAPQMPPKVISISCEEVKAYADAEHAKLEAAWTKALAKGNWPVHILGMTSMFGQNEAWFIVGFDSFAAVEKSNQAIEKNPAMQAVNSQFAKMDKDNLHGWHGILASLREDLSYQPAVILPQMRYFRVNTIRVRPGLNDDFIEYRKIIKAALEKAHSETHFAIYQTVSGASNGTFLIFTPLKSMAEMDPNPANQKAVQDALGDENRKRLSELANKAIISNEPVHFAFNPEISYVPKEFAAADPDYWTPKPKPAVKPAAQKTTQKPGGAQ